MYTFFLTIDGILTIYQNCKNIGVFRFETGLLTNRKIGKFFSHFRVKIKTEKPCHYCNC